MKQFAITLSAILVAAAIILSGLWAKGRLDAWEYAWRSSEAEAAAIVDSHRVLEYSAPFSSSEVNLARLEQISAELKRIEIDGTRINEIEKRTIAILEQKPFGLPLSASERAELTMLKEDVRKQSTKKSP